jgi:flavin reductase (DIM6/NTAB) family NADH-FMN oxidoreductase RutF
MLVTAGNGEKHNTMTASWGQMGILWNKPVVNVYIRPQRYTREFVEAQEWFSLSFFEGETQRKALSLLGSKSGRDGDKIAETGLHVQMLDNVPAFAEARLVLVCKKLYVQDIQPESFLEKSLIKTSYPAADFHRMYVAEIEKAYKK